MRALAGLLTLALAAPAAAADGRYAFQAGSAELSITLSAAEGGARLLWPKAGAFDTALLGVEVSGTGDDEPSVEMQAGAIRVTQVLEKGARGLSWLNVSALKAELREGAAVELRSHGLALGEHATLRLFANGLDLKGRILVLAPHPDDAELAAFGVYAGRNATIVTVTSGNAGDSNYSASFADPAQQYLFKGYLRALDSVTVPWQGGIPPERCFNLGYFDARLEEMHAKPDAVVPEMYGPNTDVSVYRRVNLSHLLPSGPRTQTWRHLVEDLVSVLKKVDPAIVVMPHPGLDSHPDHQYVAVAAVEALARWKKPARFLLYTNHAYQNLFPFGPPDTVVSLPPFAAGELPVEAAYSHPLAPDLQRRKLFALEAMHDLRPAPAEQGLCVAEGGPYPRPDWPRVAAVDYFRRGPRPNEIFFVFGRDGAQRLIQSFLGGRAAAR